MLSGPGTSTGLPTGTRGPAAYLSQSPHRYTVSMSHTGPLVGAYRQYKADARGWGDPGFAEFRARLYPLRRKRSAEAWSEDDMLYVMGLEAEGGARALQKLFAGNPVAVEILGADPRQAEPIHRDELDARLRGLIRSCEASGWGRGEFASYVAYLDSDTTPADLGGKSGRDAESDDFAAAYRGASAGYKRRVREALVAAAGEHPP